MPFGLKTLGEAPWPRGQGIFRCFSETRLCLQASPRRASPKHTRLRPSDSAEVPGPRPSPGQSPGIAAKAGKLLLQALLGALVTLLIGVSVAEAACVGGSPNGTVQFGEACDDNNAVETDECSSQCVFTLCGDFIIQQPNGTGTGGFLDDGVEECDQGTSNATNGLCTLQCTLTFCGDGVVQNRNGTGVGGIHNNGYEQCDDGNGINGDGCTTICTLESVAVTLGVKKEISSNGITFFDANDSSSALVVPSGTNVTYRVTLSSSNGGVTFAGTKVTDVFTGVANVSRGAVTAISPITVTFNPLTGVFSLPNFAGTSFTFIYQALVSGTGNLSRAKNEVTISDSGLGSVLGGNPVLISLNPAKDSAFVGINPPIVDLSVTKSAPASIAQGGILTTTLTVSNSGAVTATNIVVTDVIPSSELTFNASLSSTSCSLAGTSVKCTIASLAPASFTALTIAFNVSATAQCSSVYKNMASATATELENDPSDNTSNETVTSVTCPVLATTLNLVKDISADGFLFETADSATGALKISEPQVVTTRVTITSSNPLVTISGLKVTDTPQFATGVIVGTKYPLNPNVQVFGGTFSLPSFQGTFVLLYQAKIFGDGTSLQGVAASNASITSPGTGSTPSLNTVTISIGQGTNFAYVTLLSQSLAGAPQSGTSPSCSLAVNPDFGVPGDEVTLTWTTLNATAVSIEGATVLLFGSLKDLLPGGVESKTYTLTTSGNGPDAVCSATVSMPSGARNPAGQRGGRRLHATPVRVDTVKEVSRDGRAYVTATSPLTAEKIVGNKAYFRIRVFNRSSEILERVRILDTFVPASVGPQTGTITSVEGAEFFALSKVFIIDRVPARSEARITFTMTFEGNLRGVVRNSATLQGFDVLIRSTTGNRQAEKQGIGVTDDAYFGPGGTIGGDGEEASPRGGGMRDGRGEASEGGIPSRKPFLIEIISLNDDPLQPGSVLHLLIRVTNTSGDTFRNISISNRGTEGALSILNPNTGSVQNGTITWSVPELRPGQRFEVQTLLKISDVLPVGATIIDTVTVDGESVSGIPLSDRQKSVAWKIGTLPITGVDLDVLEVQVQRISSAGVSPLLPRAIGSLLFFALLIPALMLNRRRLYNVYGRVLATYAIS